MYRQSFLSLICTGINEILTVSLLTLGTRILHAFQYTERVKASVKRLYNIF